MIVLIVIFTWCHPLQRNRWNLGIWGSPREGNLTRDSETNSIFAPENWCLEYFLVSFWGFGRPIFRGELAVNLYISIHQANFVLIINSGCLWKLLKISFISVEFQGRLQYTKHPFLSWNAGPPAGPTGRGSLGEMVVVRCFKRPTPKEFFARKLGVFLKMWWF